MITTTTRTQVTQGEVYAEVRATLAAPFESGHEISDGAAMTIAAWWQSPRDGLAFAQLASTGRVEVTDLLDAIATTRHEATGIDSTALDCLATWAMNHPSRDDV